MDEERRAERPASFREWVLEHDLSRFTLDPFIRDELGEVVIDGVVRFEHLREDMTEICRAIGIPESIDLPLRKWESTIQKS